MDKIDITRQHFNNYQHEIILLNLAQRNYELRNNNNMIFTLNGKIKSCTRLKPPTGRKFCLEFSTIGKHTC